MNEQEILQRYSTPGLRRNTLDRTAKREQLERVGTGTQDIPKILDDLFGPEQSDLVSEP